MANNEETQEPDIDDPEVVRRSEAIALVSDWETDRNLHIEIGDKYDLADRIMEVMPIEQADHKQDQIVSLQQRLDEAKEVIKLAATTHHDYLWKAKEWLQQNN